MDKEFVEALVKERDRLDSAMPDEDVDVVVYEDMLESFLEETESE